MYTQHAKFQKASFNSNWDVKQWNKMVWIDTFTSPSTFLCYNFSFGSIPSPQKVHSIAFLQQHLVGEVKVLIQNFLFHRVLHVGEVKFYSSVSLRTGGRSMFYKHLLFFLRYCWRVRVCVRKLSLCPNRLIISYPSFAERKGKIGLPVLVIVRIILIKTL